MLNKANVIPERLEFHDIFPVRNYQDPMLQKTVIGVIGARRILGCIELTSEVAKLSDGFGACSTLHLAFLLLCFLTEIYKYIRWE